jgi:hypothetical protein
MYTYDVKAIWRVLFTFQKACLAPPAIFSKVSDLVFLLCKGNMVGTFQNVCLAPPAIFSKVSELVFLLCKGNMEGTFQNVCLAPAAACCASNAEAALLCASSASLFSRSRAAAKSVLRAAT